MYLLIAVPLVPVVGVVHYRWYDVRREIALRERLNIARLTGTAFNTFTMELGRSLELEGQTIVDNAFTPGRARPHLRRLFDQYPVEYVVFLNSRGDVLMSTDTRLLGTNMSREPAVRTLLDGPGGSALDPVEKVGDTVGFHIARAIRSGPRLGGVILALVDVERLRQVFRVAVPAGGQSILDSRGVVVYNSEYPELAQSMASWANQPLVREVLDGREAVTQDFSHPPSFQQRVAAMSPIADTGWIAASSVSAREVLDPVESSILQSALILGSVLLVALGLAGLLARNIARSLRRLASGARRVGLGNFDEPVLLRTGDEVEEVALSLDETRLKLKGYVEGLAAIGEAGRSLSGSLEIKELERAIVHSLEHLFGAAASWVLLHNQKSGLLETLFFHGEGLDSLRERKVTPGEGMAGQVFVTSQPAVVSDLAAHPEVRSREALLRQGHRSLVQLPLAIGTRPFGVLGMSSLRTGSGEFGGREMELLQTFASQVSIALQNALLFQERERSASLSIALNRVNAALISTLDLERVLGHVVREAAEIIGCERAVMTVAEGDFWRVAHTWGWPPDWPRIGLSLEDLPISSLAAHARSAVIINEAENDPRISPAEARRLGIRSFMALPLLVHDEVIGVLSFTYTSAPVAFTEAEIDFAQKLAISLSLAQENARLYAAEQDIADTLQEALLTLPAEIAGIEFGQLYRSATELARVGGDFYDLFEVEHDRVGILIGDVSGKGLEAAALTSLVKNTVKAYAYEDTSPAAILAKTNQVVLGSSPPASFVTVFLGLLDKRSGSLCYASAGHPPGLLVGSSGALTVLEPTSGVIGVFPGQAYEEKRVSMNDGSMLLLYTDGVIEARRGQELFGEQRLQSLCPALRGEPAPAAARRVFAEVNRFSEGTLSDDIALLAVRLKMS